MRMPSGPSRAASERVRPMSPCFDAVYDGMLPWPISPSIDEMPTTAAPGPASRSDGSSALTSTASAHRFTPSTNSNSCALNGSCGPIGTPAACTNPPMLPSASSVAAIAPAIASPSRTSIAREMLFTPRSAHCDAVSAAPASLRSHAAIGRPTSASARQTSRPMPEPPPVTTTGDDGVLNGAVMSATSGSSALGAEVRDHVLAPLTDRLEAHALFDRAHLDEAHDLVGAGVGQPLRVLDGVAVVAVAVVDVESRRGARRDRDLRLVEIRDHAVGGVTDLGDVVGVRIDDLTRGRSASVPVRDRLGEEPLTARADLQRGVTVVENDRRTERREMVVHLRRHEPLAVARRDRLVVASPHRSNVVGAGEPEHERSDAVLGGELHRVALRTREEQGRVRDLDGARQDRSRRTDLQQLAVPLELLAVASAPHRADHAQRLFDLRV